MHIVLSGNEWMSWILIHTALLHRSSMRPSNASMMEVLRHVSQAYRSIELTLGTGLLCVTCTDLSVLGNTNYPEKW